MHEVLMYEEENDKKGKMTIRIEKIENKNNIKTRKI